MRQDVMAVLCGGLNMLRCFVKGGIPTLLVSSDPHDIAFHSKYCHEKGVVANPISDWDKTVKDLVELGQTFTEKPVLFYGNDAMLLLVSRNRGILSRYFRFLMPDADQVEDLVHKTRFALLAKRLGLPVPKTVLSSEIMRSEEIGQYLSFPCILKPNHRMGWFRSMTIMLEGAKPRKVLKANNPVELDCQLKKMKLFTNDFIIQEYVSGNDKCIYSFHAYLNHHSEVLAYFVGKKIRTYPKGSGISTYLELVKEPEIVRLSLEILMKLKFVGVVKIDFKKDPDKNLFYLLEINPRFNLWHYLGAVCGINLPQVAYTDLLGEGCKNQLGYRTGIKWLSFGDDLRAFIKDYHKDGDLSWWQWLLSYRCPKIYDIFSWQDPCPFVFSLLGYSKALYRRLTKRFVR